MPWVAITDTSNIHWCHELYKYAKEEGITPILWSEIYLQSLRDHTMLHKIVLLAQNLTGYQNIIALVSKANLERPWDKPYILWEELAEKSEFVICLSGPISGEIPYAILSGREEGEIMEVIERYRSVFAERFFVELLYHDDIPKQRLVTERLIELYYKYRFPVVACNNSYYINKDDKQTQDIIRALGTGHTIKNPDRPTLLSGDYSFSTPEEMESMFGFLPEALKNSVKICEMVDIHIEIGAVLIPKYDLPEEDQAIYDEVKVKEIPLYALAEDRIKELSSDEWYLRYLSFKGLNWRYEAWLSQDEITLLVQKLDVPWLNKTLTKTSPEELKEQSLKYISPEKKVLLSRLSEDMNAKIDRLEYELVVVHEMGFDAYFLIVADYINYARTHDVPVGPWRGSAAGSLMAYLSGITDIDPLPYSLLFERFLNPARISMPDIDTDFSDDGRDQVIEYCRKKYGADHVAQICTFGTFAARAAVKDVGRVMGIWFAEMNDLAKLIPEKPWTKLSQALTESLEFKHAYDSNPVYHEIIENALKIEGNVRQVGVHACAVIIAPHPMTNYTALSHPPKDKNAIITQYSAYPLEDLGLLKMDFLGLRNLTIIKRALKIIKKRKGDEINILKINLHDAKVFQVFSAGDTTGVFQFESEGMRKYLIDLGPDTFEDLIAMVSLYRPWPLAYIPAYIDRKYGREPIAYLTDALKEILKGAKHSDEVIAEEKRKLEEDLSPILDVTYGIAVYQEQLMFIVQYMAGFSLGEADMLRRWIGKKKIEIIEALKKEFITRAESFKGYKPETSRYIYEEMIQPAANYSFNKSHAACYALIAYQTAYLKAYYRTEFLTSVMVSDEENMERIVMEVSECNSKGIEVLPPSINESMKHFTYINDETIRFGLKAIKGIGDGPIEAIKKGKEAGPYQSLEDFVTRAGKEVINKKSLESLILSWALDLFWERGMLYKNIENIIRFMRAGEKKSTTSQMGLFDSIAEHNGLHLDVVERFSYEEKLNGERDVIGFSISGHPLDGLSRYIAKRSQNTKILAMSFEAYEALPQKQKDKMEITQAVGYVRDFRTTMTKTWGTMGILYIESFLYDFEVTIFQKDYERLKQQIILHSIVIVNGMVRVNTEYKRKTVLARELKALSLTLVREQARSLQLLDEKRYQPFIKAMSQGEIPKVAVKDTHEVQEEAVQENEVQAEEEPHEIQVELTEYVIEIPSTAKMSELHELKDFLSKEPAWEIQIFIFLQWKKIDTKSRVASLDHLKVWEEKHFKKQ